MKNGKFWVTTLLFFVIFVILTPSIIFYTRSSDAKILFHEAEKITKQIELKQSDAKDELLPWITHILNSQGVKTTNCSFHSEYPHIITVKLNDANDSDKAAKIINYSAYSGSRPNPSVTYQTSNVNYHERKLNDDGHNGDTVYISINIRNKDHIHSVNTLAELEKQTQQQTYFFKSYSEKLFSKIFDVLNKNIFEDQILTCEENNESASRLFDLMDDILLTLDSDDEQHIFVGQILAKEDVARKLPHYHRTLKPKTVCLRKRLLN